MPWLPSRAGAILKRLEGIVPIQDQNFRLLLVNMAEELKRIASLELRLQLLEVSSLLTRGRQAALWGLGALILAIPTLALGFFSVAAWLNASSDIPLWACCAWVTLAGLLLIFALLYFAARSWNHTLKEGSNGTNASGTGERNQRLLEQAPT